MTHEQRTIVKAITDGDTMFLTVIRVILILGFILTMLWLTPLDVFGEDAAPDVEPQQLDAPLIVPGGVTIENYTDNNGVVHQCTYVCNPVGKMRVCNTVCL